MYIYFYHGEDGRLLYIGSTKNVLIRFQQHKESDYWMDSVCSITVKGKYEVAKALYFEKYYISKEKPIYNKRCVYTDICNEKVFDNAPETCFNSVESFISYYKSTPEMLYRATYYLRKVDIEAMNILKYYTGEDLVDIAPKAFEIGIKEIIKELGYHHIYKEAYDRVISLGVGKKHCQKNSTTASMG